ncbi:MAG: hypothetical protein AB7G06_07745 [Bdellovibrionales bacterium]
MSAAVIAENTFIAKQLELARFGQPREAYYKIKDTQRDLTLADYENLQELWNIEVAVNTPAKELAHLLAPMIAAAYAHEPNVREKTLGWLKTFAVITKEQTTWEAGRDSWLKSAYAVGEMFEQIGYFGTGITAKAREHIPQYERVLATLLIDLAKDAMKNGRTDWHDALIYHARFKGQRSVLFANTMLDFVEESLEKIPTSKMLKDVLHNAVPTGSAINAEGEDRGAILTRMMTLRHKKAAELTGNNAPVSPEDFEAVHAYLKIAKKPSADALDTFKRGFDSKSLVEQYDFVSYTEAQSQEPTRKPFEQYAFETLTKNTLTAVESHLPNESNDENVLTRAKVVGYLHWLLGATVQNSPQFPKLMAAYSNMHGYDVTPRAAPQPRRDRTDRPGI